MLQLVHFSSNGSKYEETLCVVWGMMVVTEGASVVYKWNSMLQVVLDLRVPVMGPMFQLFAVQKLFYDTKYGHEINDFAVVYMKINFGLTLADTVNPLMLAIQ